MSDSISKLKKIQAEAEAFLDDRRLAREAHKMTRWQRFLHFWVVVGRGFIENRLPVRASALAYTTLLALIPLLAVGAGVATSFLKGENGHKQIEEWVGIGIDKLAPQLGLVAKAEAEKKHESTQPGTASANREPDARARVVKIITDAIDNVSGGALGSIGTVALMFVAISLLSTIEGTLNDIWGVRRGRSWFARVVQYWAVITLAPLLLLTALTLNVSAHLEFAQVLFKNAFFKSLVAQVMPIVILTITFSLFYLLMPNTRVNWKAALIGGVVAGLLVHLNHTFSTVYFGQVVRNSKIYGSMAILPILLISLYFWWVILLFGAQVSYAFQNRRICLEEKEAENINQSGREFVALRLMTAIAHRFQNHLPPATAMQLAEDISVPTKLVQKILEPLLAEGLIHEVAGREMAYAPAQPLQKISYLDILQTMRRGTGHELETRDEPSRQVVRGELDKIQQAEQTIAAAITLDKVAL